MRRVCSREEKVGAILVDLCPGRRCDHHRGDYDEPLVRPLIGPDDGRNAGQAWPATR